MSTFEGFSTDELVAISRFAGSFCDLYGYRDYHITDRVRGALPLNPVLTRLIVKLQADAACFAEFQTELAERINSRIGHVNPLVVSSASDEVCRVFGFPEDTMLLAIFPKTGASDDDMAPVQLRHRWTRTRLLVIADNGIQRVRVDLDTPVSISIPN